MASSRWKRFAFFERRNLTLPIDVVDDLIPNDTLLDQGGVGGKGSGVGKSRSSRKGRTAGRKEFPAEEEEKMAGKAQESGRSDGGGDFFSFVVTQASLPPSIVIQNMNASASSSSSPSMSGTSGMVQTLAATCSPPPSASSASAAATATAAPLAGIVTMVGGQLGPARPITTANTGTTASASASSATAAVTRAAINNGLVLAFAASQASSWIHCVDLTVRSHPSSSNTATTTANGGAAVLEQDISEPNPMGGGGTNFMASMEVEDLDGYRGSFNPFARALLTPSTTSATSSASAHNPAPERRSRSTAERRIIDDHLTPLSNTTKSTSSANHQLQLSPSVLDLAVASSPSSRADNAANIKPSLRLAAITNLTHSLGVVVCIDPHFYLTPLPPNKTPNTTIPPSALFQPNAPFDFKNRGHPTSVDLTFQLCAVGTDLGRVIIYSYNASSSTLPPPPAEPDSSSSAARTGNLSAILEIPPPPSNTHAHLAAVTSLRLITEDEPNATTPSSSNAADTNTTTHKSRKTRTRLFVTYAHRRSSTSLPLKTKATVKSATATSSSSVLQGLGGTATGVCCYDLGAIAAGVAITAPSARYDLDRRDVHNSSLCDSFLRTQTRLPEFITDHPNKTKHNPIEQSFDHAHYVVARVDGLYTYSYTDKVGVSPIDGSKIAMCTIPPPPTTKRRIAPLLMSRTKMSKANGPDGAAGDGGTTTPASLDQHRSRSGASYALVASTDSKSGRDAVDIYDSTNKLVAFHVLLSPGHRALRAGGVTTMPSRMSDGTTRGGRSSAIVLTSGGSIVTLTEKVTSEKVSLLVQKNLYTAAISMAYADPSYQPVDIVALYRRHAEHLYRKGEFGDAMDQYIYTIGSLEPSHVIFRYLDAPKIPLLVRYLETLRAQDLSSLVHDELLKTCYLKLNDSEAADKISASLGTSLNDISILSSLADNPTEALATICSFEPPQAAEALVVHGATLARALPRETAGIVVALCDGTYSPSALADAAAGGSSKLDAAASSSAEGGNNNDNERPTVCERYPIHLFSNAFLENPKLLRLILAHCRKKKCILTPSLQRALLELTLEEWNAAKRTNDADMERQRKNEAMAILTDSHFDEIGDYEALVIAQTAGFDEGEVFLYERLQMAPMLLERYAKDGSDRARRQMLAMCRGEPELLADVLAYFVSMASDRMGQQSEVGDDMSDSDDEADEILQDIREALYTARAQGVLPPVRIARILAGEGVGEFSRDASLSSSSYSGKARSGISEVGDSVPLSVALDYIGAILDESSTEINRLKGEVEEYNEMCNSMETEIKSLLSYSKADADDSMSSPLPRVDIEDMYAKVKESADQSKHQDIGIGTEIAQEEFWREMGHSEDRFQTIGRFFAKGIMN